MEDTEENQRASFPLFLSGGEFDDAVTKRRDIEKY